MIGYNPAIEKNRIISIAKGILRCYNQFHYVYRTCGHDVCRFFDKDWKDIQIGERLKEKRFQPLNLNPSKRTWGIKYKYEKDDCIYQKRNGAVHCIAACRYFLLYYPAG